TPPARPSISTARRISIETEPRPRMHRGDMMDRRIKQEETHMANHWKPVVACVAIAAFALGMGSAAAQEKVLRITSFGSGFRSGQRAAFFKPFEQATGIKVIEDTWNGEIGKIRAMVQSGKITSDLFAGNPWDGITGCEEGILEKIDKKFLGDTSDFM